MGPRDRAVTSTLPAPVPRAELATAPSSPVAPATPFTRAFSDLTRGDVAIAGGKGSLAARRVSAVTAMLVGGLIGAAFVVHVRDVYPLALALLLLVAVVMATRLLSRSELPWARA